MADSTVVCVISRSSSGAVTNGAMAKGAPAGMLVSRGTFVAGFANAGVAADAAGIRGQGSGVEAPEGGTFVSGRWAGSSVHVVDRTPPAGTTPEVAESDKNSAGTTDRSVVGTASIEVRLNGRRLLGVSSADSSFKSTRVSWPSSSSGDCVGIGSAAGGTADALGTVGKLCTIPLPERRFGAGASIVAKPLPRVPPLETSNCPPEGSVVSIR